MSNAAASSSTPFLPKLPSRPPIRPPNRIGMRTLDRKAFEQAIPLLAARVQASKVGSLRSHPVLRKYLLKIPRIPQVVVDPQNEQRRLLRLSFDSEDDMPDDLREVLSHEAEGMTDMTIKLNYNYWSAPEILHAILPTTVDEDIPTAFTVTGHIAHLNLRDEWLPYKELIGQVILDKNPKIRTVVNKLSEIHAQYRYFDMEVIAGEHDFITTLSESSCTFTFDFSRVYWNSRLSGEHDRLVDLLKPGEVVADVMAGVGPFAVPAAKKGCLVMGNDLNPESVRWMRENRVKNKVEATLRVSELDGKNFIRQSPLEAWHNPFQEPIGVPTKRELKEKRHQRDSKVSQSAKPGKSLLSPSSPPEQPVAVSLPPEPQLVKHFIMNLPDSALTFLDAFIGLYAPLSPSKDFTQHLASVGEEGLPMIHVYCFTREMEYEAAETDILERASRHLQYALTPLSHGYRLHLVRSVAPNKEMYCLMFRLPREVAFAEIVLDKEDTAPFESR